MVVVVEEKEDEEESKREAHAISMLRGHKHTSLLLPTRPSEFGCLDNQLWHAG